MKKMCIVVTITAAALMLGIGTASAQKDWKAWQHRLPIRLVHRAPGTADLVPVDVTFSLFADLCPNPEKDIRLVLKTPGGEKEIPFQLSRLSKWTKNTDGEKSKPTQNGMITFFDEAKGSGAAEYFLLYGNPSAQAPVYETDLKVSGSEPAWTVENGKMTVALHKSGQISSVTLKDNPGVPIAPNTEILHWNPGVCIPTIHWAHAFDWDPPETCEIQQGPLFVEIIRSGVFPTIPDVHLSITYRIFAGRTYVESGTVLRVTDDIGVVSLRNNELVFDEGFFTHIGWDKNNAAVVKPLAGYKPINRHGDILRLPDTVPYVTLFNPATGIGAATVHANLSKIGPNGDPPVLFDNATYISNGHLQYWFRSLVYFHVDWSRQQLITVPEGSTYSERNLYLFYRPGSGGSIDEVVRLSKAVRSTPAIEIGEYLLPPAE